MMRPLLLAALLASGTALAQPLQADPRVLPAGVGGSAPAHLHGSDGADGGPVIHRPDQAAGAVVSMGVARMQGGGDEKAITYEGAPRGSLGGRVAPRITGNDGGGPVLSGG